MIGTKNPMEEHFMVIASFGAIQITVTPTTADPGIFSVDIAAQNRKEAVAMQTNKDETIDQFCTRIRSMLRGLANTEPRVLPQERVTAEPKKNAKSWDEQKSELKAKS